jgi:uncharacterized membrane protein YhaH (DUF805 family)
METKKCPYCDKTVLAISKACKHCGKSFEDYEINSEETQEQIVGEQVESNANSEEEYQINKVLSNKSMFKQSFSFDGRIRRLEYGLSFMIYIVYFYIIRLLFFSSYDSNIMGYVFLIPGYIFLWAQGSKRCHDRNNSGWYQLIPFYGLWMLFASGDEGVNNYGESPK